MKRVINVFVTVLMVIGPLVLANEAFAQAGS